MTYREVNEKTFWRLVNLARSNERKFRNELERLPTDSLIFFSEKYRTYYDRIYQTLEPFVIRHLHIKNLSKDAESDGEEVEKQVEEKKIGGKIIEKIVSLKRKTIKKREIYFQADEQSFILFVNYILSLGKIYINILLKDPQKELRKNKKLLFTGLSVNKKDDFFQCYILNLINERNKRHFIFSSDDEESCSDFEDLPCY